MHNNDDARQPLSAVKSSGNPTMAGCDESLLAPWRRLAGCVSPMIGESGFCALHGRAIRLIAPEFAWLSPMRSAGTLALVLQGLAERYAAVHPSTAAAANVALLNTFSKLLSTLIGAALTKRLLASADGEQAQQYAQEHNNDK